jgi:hypothetical protein
MAVSDLASRPTRTLVQGGIAGAVVEFTDVFFYDMSDRQYGAAIVLLTILFSYVQVLIENRTGKSLLRNYDSVDGSVVESKPGGAV